MMIGIVGHTTRLDMAETLAGKVGAEYVSIDDGTLGCEQNHRKVWTHLAQHSDGWAITIEDDAQPIPNFRAHAQAALAAAPTPIVSFYLGHPDHWRRAFPDRRRKLFKAGQEADATGAHWLTTQDILHGVAIALRTELITDMLTHIEQSPLAIDYAIRNWCRTRGHTIAFTWPSLVDHHDGRSLIRRRRPHTHPRKAWRTRTHANWNSHTISFADNA